MCKNKEYIDIATDKIVMNKLSEAGLFYFILYSENRCISKLDKIGIFIDMKFY